MADKNMFLKNYSFYGKHADMAEFLTSKIDEDSGATIFNSVVELFIMSAFIGIKNNHKVKPDTDKSRDKKIMAEQFNSHIQDIRLAFKIVILLGNKDKYDEISRLNKAFRNPDVDENYRDFEEYMLGGLEDIYNKFIVNVNSYFSDYLTSANQLLSELKVNELDEIDDIPDSENLFD